MLKALFRLVVVAVLLAAVVVYFRWFRPGVAGGDLAGIRSRVEDAKTAALVKAAIALNRDLARCEISASAEEAVVTLRGEVPDKERRVRAEAIAAAVPNVRQVVNHLRVVSGGPSPEAQERTLGERVDDRAVEMRVRLALSLDRRLSGSQIDVSVFRRAVTLSGSAASTSDAESALSLVRDTEGVTSVIDRLSVRGEGASQVARVRRALLANTQISINDLVVQQRGGRIVLDGAVRSGAERELAGLLTEKVSGTSVDNRLHVIH